MTLYFKTVGFKLRFSNRRHFYRCLSFLTADSVAVGLRPLDISNRWFESPLKVMDFHLVCLLCVFLGSGLYNGLITGSGGSYRLCVFLCV